jgi:glucose/arabinose dehydrogenase
MSGLTEVGRHVVIADLPSEHHTTRTVLFGRDGNLYVSMGSSCNVCIEADRRRAAVTVYEANGEAPRQFATGLRNAVGLAVEPTSGGLWATNNGADGLGNDRPPETVYHLRAGLDAGWPRCHAGTIPDPGYGEGPDPCRGVARPDVTLPAHSAPLGLTFYEGNLFPAEYRGDMFIAFHGSWNRFPPTGYKVVRVPFQDGRPAGVPEDFATGWLEDDLDSPGRPVGVTVAADGALFVSDDKGGYIYRIARSE